MPTRRPGSSWRPWRAACRCRPASRPERRGGQAVSPHDEDEDMAKGDRTAGHDAARAEAEAAAHKAHLDAATTSLTEVGVILRCERGRDVRDRAREVMERLSL